MKSVFFLVLLSVFALQVHGHGVHELPGIEATQENWQRHLMAFRHEGRAEDLNAARVIASKLVPAKGKAASPQLLLLAAQTAQADHRFDESVRLLRRLLELEPQHVGARLMLANVLTVTGQAAAARNECARTFGDVPVLVGLSCAAQTHLAQGGALEQRLIRLRVIAKRELSSLNPPLRSWVLGVMGDMAWALQRSEIALQLYRQAYGAEPLIRYQTVVVDILLHQGLHRKALQLASAYPGSLSMQVKHLVAAKSLGELARHVKHATKSTQLGITAKTSSRSSKWLDGIHQRITGSNVYTRFLVAHHLPATGKICLHLLDVSPDHDSALYRFNIIMDAVYGI